MKNWIIENFSAIIAGLISSIIVLLLQVFAALVINSLTFYLTKRLTLSRIFGIKDGDSIYIASGEIPNSFGYSDNATTMKGPDLTAANYVFKTLQEIYKKSNIKHIYTGADKNIHTYSENIICVGGPKYNSTTKHFLTKLPDEFGFDSQNNLKGGKEISYNHEDLKRNIDYGLLAKIKNPYANNKYIFVVAGCGTHGVLASSYLISNQKYSPKLKTILKKKLGRFSIKKNEFVAIVKCNTSNNEIAKPEILSVNRI